MTRLYLLDPAPTPAWEPFAYTRPIAELRAGVLLLRERWEAALDMQTTAILSSPLAGFEDTTSIPVIGLGTPIEGPALIVRSEFIPAGPVPILTGPGVFVDVNQQPQGWYVPAGHSWDGSGSTGPISEIAGHALGRTTDLLDLLDHLLLADCLSCVHPDAVFVPPGSILLGDPDTLCAAEAFVEPGVVFDLREGPVVLEPGVEVRSGTRLEGPLYVHSGTHILGGAIRRSVIGPQCRVHGEVSSSIFVGYANKSHEGFVGHSVIGHWVNLGAGTITSNLKNTYGTITLQTADGVLPTDRTNVGSLIGDHAKTAIGTLLPTGTIVGTGASLHGAAAAPKRVPPFAWGATGAEQMQLEGFLNTAERVLPRRGVQFTEGVAASLRALYQRHCGGAR